ncbi:hypothetical protein LTR95_007112 [Oleoguttula sp. CCFEE 5521]
MAHRRPIDRTREQLVRARIRIEELQVQIREQRVGMQDREHRYADIRHDLAEASREIRRLTERILLLDQEDVLCLYDGATNDVRRHVLRARRLRFDLDDTRRQMDAREEEHATETALLHAEIRSMQAERDQANAPLEELEGHGLEADAQQPPSPAETEGGREDQLDDDYMSPGGRATSP